MRVVPEEYPLLVDDTRLITIPAQIAGAAQAVAVDSGSTLNIMSDNCAQTHNLSIKSCPTNITLTMADGTKASPDGITAVSLQIGDEVFDIDCLILNNFPYGLLLGLDFMRSAPLDIIASEGILRVGKRKTEFELPLRHDTVTTLMTQEKTVIRPHTQQMLMLKGKGMHGARDFLVEGLQEVLAPLCLPPVVTRVKHRQWNSDVCVCIVNNTSAAVTIPALTAVASASPVRSEACLSIEALFGDVPADKRPSTPAPRLRTSQLNISSHLTSDQRKQLIATLEGLDTGVFSLSEYDLGRTSLIKHHIDTGDAAPVRSGPYRKSFQERQVLKIIVSELKKAKVVRDSWSPWAAPVVLVKKKDGGYRLCCDWRKLNAVTKKDSMPLPRVDDTLDRLAGSAFFTTLDLPSGYFQVDLDQESIEKSAFVTPDGCYEFLAMGQGLCNAPATFQRLMQRALGELMWTCCMAYLDDILIFSRTFEDHIRDVKAVLTALHAAGLKVKPKKCSFAQDQTKFLGHVISGAGILPDPDKLKALEQLRRPKNVKEVQQFLGLASYYRRFVANFAAITKPLTLLLRKQTPWHWTDKQDVAFESIKSLLMSPPVLAHPNFSKPFIVSTDASGFGLGAVLKQIGEDNKCHVIAYASRNMNQAEMNYSATERECLAVIFAVNKFRPYVFGTKFSIVTDHCALCWLMKVRNPNGRLVRWSLTLQDYEFDVEYESGRKHLDADLFSRMPVDPAPASEEIPLLALSGDAEVISVRELQRQELWLQPILTHLTDPEYAGVKRSVRRKARGFLLRDGIVFKRIINPDGMSVALVVPASLRKEVLAAMHDHVTSGHLGLAKTWKKMRIRFFWPKMFADVREYVLSCKKCGAQKSSHQAPVGFLQPLAPTTKPFERVGIDKLGPFKRSIDGNVHILVLTEYTTRMVFARAVPNGTAHETAKFLVEEILTRHGTPKIILTDRGVEFVAETFECIARTYGCTHLTSSSYHPRTSGLTERFNATIAKMIGMYTDTHDDWDRFLPHLIFAYNTSVQETTGYSPYFLMHGYEPTLGIEAQLNQSQTLGENFAFENIAYANRAREIAAAATERSQARAKERFDEHRRDFKYNAGDKVWIRRMRRYVGKTDKLLPAYVGPFVVLCQTAPNNYLVEDEAGKTDTVNVERLKPYVTRIEGSAPVDVSPPLVIPPAEEVQPNAPAKDVPPAVPDEDVSSLPPYLVFDNMPTAAEAASIHGNEAAGESEQASASDGESDSPASDENEVSNETEDAEDPVPGNNLTTRSGRISRPPGWIRRCAPSTFGCLLAIGF